MKLQDSFFFFPRCCSKRGSGVSSRESWPFPALPWAAAAMGGAGYCGRLSSPPRPAPRDRRTGRADAVPTRKPSPDPGVLPSAHQPPARKPHAHGSREFPLWRRGRRVKARTRNKGNSAEGGGKPAVTASWRGRDRAPVGPGPRPWALRSPDRLATPEATSGLSGEQGDRGPGAGLGGSRSEPI